MSTSSETEYALENSDADHPSINQTLLQGEITSFSQFVDHLGDLPALKRILSLNRTIHSMASLYQATHIELTGSGFNFLFATPHNALSTAVSIQRFLQVEREDCAGHPVSMRIAAHCGQVYLCDSAPFGSQVVLTAALVRCGAPNEIIVSEQTQRLLPSDWEGTIGHRRTSYLAGASGETAFYSVNWKEICKLFYPQLSS